MWVRILPGVPNIMTDQNEVIDKSHHLFMQFMKRLPTNEKAIYIQLQLSDCILYVPTSSVTTDKINREKRAYEALIKHAKY